MFVIVLLAISSCALAETAAAAGDPGQGRETFEKRGCRICHSIDRTGGAVGPDLTQVTVRRTDEWLAAWLKDPPSLLKDTDMPSVPWKSENEISGLIAYFKTFRKDINRDFLGKVSGREAGKRLVKEYDCRACHRIVDKESGRARFPDLTREGRKRTRAWIDNWLKDPQAVKPGTFMPAFPLTEAERSAIAEYVSTLR